MGVFHEHLELRYIQFQSQFLLATVSRSVIFEIVRFVLTLSHKNRVKAKKMEEVKSSSEERKENSLRFFFAPSNFSVKYVKHVHEVVLLCICMCSIHVTTLETLFCLF